MNVGCGEIPNIIRMLSHRHLDPSAVHIRVGLPGLVYGQLHAQQRNSENRQPHQMPVAVLEPVEKDRGGNVDRHFVDHYDNRQRPNRRHALRQAAPTQANEARCTKLQSASTHPSA